MTFIIPNQSTKKHTQLNKNDLSGTIYQSRNINLDEEGYIKLSEAPYAVMTTDDDAALDTADAMYPMEDEIYVNSDEVFTGRIGVDTFSSRASDTTPPTPGVEDDVVSYNGVAVVSDSTTVKYEGSSGVWTTISGTSLSGASPTVLGVFQAENSLVIGKGNVVKFVNTSWVVNSTILTLPLEYRVSSIDSVGTQLFIGTRSDTGGEAKMFVVSSIKTSADYSYGVGCFEIMSVRPFKSSVVLITALGQLLRFNGGGFDELASLPVYASSIEWADALNDYSTVSNRAMTTDGDLVYINLSSFTQNGRLRMLPNFPSGIWCYDDTSKSLYHRYSPSYTRIEKIDGTGVTVSTTDNTFTLTSGNLNNIVTGMPVLFYDGSGTIIPELKQSVAYYIIKDSSTVFKLATSYANALAGTAIDITSAGNTAQEWYVFKTNDYGWSLYDERMSLAVLNNLLFDSAYAGRIAYTAELFSKQTISTMRTVIGGVSPFLPNRGYFVTPRLNSADVEDIYNNVIIKFKPLGADDKIIIKYKTTDKYGYPFSSAQYNNSDNWIASWTDTDTFTTTADLSSVAAGEEIEIIAGVGSGHIAHVSSISVNAGTYTVNLDEAFPFAVSGDKFYFQVDNWTLLNTITSSSQDADKNYFKALIENVGMFVQLKVELRGIGVTVSELQVLTAKR